jgi:hypothetical protein
MAAASPEQRMDELLETTADYNYVSRGYATVCCVDEGGCPEDLPFVPIPSRCKHVTHVLDVVEDIDIAADFTYQKFKDAYTGAAENVDWSAFPEKLQPQEPLPPGCKVQLVLHPRGNGKYCAIRHLMLSSPLSAGQVAKHILGNSQLVFGRRSI